MFKNCEVCSGKGGFVMEGFNIKVDCDVCSGKGGFDIPEGKELCPKCKGKRSIEVRKDLGISIECRCENCHATGFVDKVTEELEH